MYVIRRGNVYISIAPTNWEDEKAISRAPFPIGFAWVREKGEAVRFPSRWHARAVANALSKSGDWGTVIRTRD